jgi:hypothetical protein
MTMVTIREVFKTYDVLNKRNGQQWTEHGETTAYLVIGGAGVSSKHRTIKGAEKAKKELQDFYNKFNL